MKKQKKFILFFLIFFISGCQMQNEPKKYEAEFLNLFNTVTQITGYTKNKDEFTKNVQIIYDELEQYHQFFDIYNNYEGIQNIKTINDKAGIEAVKVDSSIINLLLLGKEMYQKTNGKVNIALGSVLSIWHDYRSKGIEDPKHSKLPPMKLLIDASKHTDMNQVMIDQTASTVYLKDSKMSLDVGAIGKGYATEQVCQAIQNNNITSYLISVGGNVRAIGSKPDNSPFKVAIQNPDLNQENPYIGTVNLIDKSLVSSGNYQRYYTVSGKTYHHIINPDTLMPSEFFSQVSIICSDSGTADALSTALYNMTYEEGLALIETIPETDAMWVHLDGTIKYSSGFQNYLIK